MTDDTDLLTRPGLPAGLAVLLPLHPRESWRDDPAIAGLGRTWLGMHDHFRHVSERLAHRLDSLRETGAAGPGFAGGFQHEASGLLGHLNGHHQIEDHHYFPIFRSAEPRILRGLEIMDADHHVIHDAIERFAAEGTAFLRALGPAGRLDDKARFAADRMADEIALFRRLLARHLDDEEDLVIPLILERSDPDGSGPGPA